MVLHTASAKGGGGMQAEEGACVPVVPADESPVVIAAVTRPASLREKSQCDARARGGKYRDVVRAAVVVAAALSLQACKN